MENSEFFKVLTLTIKIYVTLAGIAGVGITYYGLCYPGFFASHAAILSALAVGTVLGTLFLAFVFVLALAIVKLKKS